MNLLGASSSLHHNLQMPWNVSPLTLSFCLTTTLHGRLYCKQSPPQGTPLLPISFQINFPEVWSIPLSHWIGMMCSLVSFLDDIFLYTGSPDLYPAFSSSYQCLNHSKHLVLPLPTVSGYQSGAFWATRKPYKPFFKRPKQSQKESAADHVSVWR